MVISTGISSIPSIEILNSEAKNNPTPIGGLYYLRDDDPLNWADVGSLLKSLPFENETTRCGMFINFHFAQEGVYIGENIIYNIYYRFWQKGYTNGEYEIGYSTSRNHTAGFDEYILVNTENYVSEVNDYRLIQAMQYTNPDIALFIDNQIYNFTIKSFGPNPEILCNPNQYSYVYLNLEDNYTLQNYDRDGDLLTDFNEFFISYTNPFDSDTDNDGYSDYIEINSGNDPNDFTDNLGSNNPPNIPTIVGPVNGKTGQQYDFRFYSIDPDGNDIYYYIDWGDNHTEEWIGRYKTGTVITLAHEWNEDGRYKIRAKAKDIYGAESDWATFKVTMPRTRVPYSPWLIRFLERSPLLEKILSLIKVI